MEGDDSLNWVMSRANASARIVLEKEKTSGSLVVPLFELWPPQETARPKDGRPLQNQPRARVTVL
jgi:hypothetical protein